MKLALFTILALIAGPAFAAMPHFDIRAIIWIVVQIVGIGIVFGLLAYLISKAPFIAEPWKQWASYFLLAVGVLIIIFYILDLIGL